MVKLKPITPSCLPKEARDRWDKSSKLLTKNDYDPPLIDRYALGTMDGETKFVFLKDAYKGAAEFYRAASQLKYKKSKRGAGRDLLFGVCFDHRNKPSLTNDTKQNWSFYNWELSPLLAWMGQTVRKTLPAYWKQQRQAANPYSYWDYSARFTASARRRTVPSTSSLLI